MVDLGIATFGEYLSGADQNYVILYNGEPIIWGGDKSPVIYADEMSVVNELHEQEAYADEENGILKDGWKVLTEFDFMVMYCKDAIGKEIGQDVTGLSHSEIADILYKKYNLDSLITNTLSKK